MPITCASCNTQNPDGNAFCSHCGTPLATAPAPAPAEQQPATPAPAPAPETPSQPAADPAAAAAPPAPSAPAAAPAPVAPAPVAPAPVAPAPVAAAPAPAPAATPAAPVGAAPQPVAPSYYAQPGATPYVPAPAGAAPVHRAPNMVVIAIVAIVVIVAGVVGGVIALAHNGPHPTPPVGPSLPPVPTAQPTAPPQPTFSAPPSSEPSVAPSVAPQPTNGPCTGCVQTSFATFTVPDGFTVASQQNGMVELRPSGGGPGQIFIEAFSLKQAVTTDEIPQFITSQLDTASTGWPNAAPCNSSAPQQTTLNGSNGAALPGVVVGVCGDYTPQNGQAFAATDVYFAAPATAPDGSPVVVAIELFMPTSAAQQFGDSVPNSFYNSVQFAVQAPTS